MTISLGGGAGPVQRRHDGARRPRRSRRRRRRTPSAKPVRPPAAEDAGDDDAGHRSAKPPKPPPTAVGSRRPTKRAAARRRAAPETGRAARWPKPGARPGLGLSTGGGAARDRRSMSPNFCCPEYLAQMIDRIRSQLGSAGRGRRRRRSCKFTIQRDGTITDISSREVERLSAARHRARSAPSSSRRQLPPLPAQYPNPDVDGSPQLSNTNDDDASYLLARASRRVDLRRAAPHGASRRRSRQPAPPQQPSEVGTAISGEAGAPPRLAVPDFIALSPTPRRKAIAQTIGQVLWDDLELRARVRADPARRLRDDPGRDVDRRRAVRSLARARRRRRASSAPCRRRPPAYTSRCGCSTCRTGRRRSRKEYTGIGGQPAAVRAHDCRRDPQAAARLHGVARTKLTFASDRDGERMTGTVENRERQGDLHLRLRRREPARGSRSNRSLNITPELVARRHDRSPTPRTAAASPTSSSRTSTRARSTKSTKAHGRRPQLPAGLVARRHADRVHVHPRRQSRDLRR